MQWGTICQVLYLQIYWHLLSCIAVYQTCECFPSKMICLFFSKLKSPLEFHYYCNICPAYIGKTNGSCSVCGKTKPNKPSYFIAVPLLSTLSSILTTTSIVFIFIFFLKSILSQFIYEVFKSLFFFGVIFKNQQLQI